MFKEVIHQIEKIDDYFLCFLQQMLRQNVIWFLS